MKQKLITLCADDIGQDPAIDIGCLELAHQGRLNAVSALSLAPHAAKLNNEWQFARHQGLQIGLHFNLTLPYAHASIYQSLPKWIFQTQLHLVDKKRIRDFLNIQLDAFEERFNHHPDFVDGHQHVHQFPVVRDVLLETLIQRYENHPKLWIRNTSPTTFSNQLPEKLKCLTLYILGGGKLKQALNQASFNTNQGCLGVYGFNATNTQAYRALMRAWLNLARENSLIMCHPAQSIVAHDAIGHQRPIEYEYFMSNEFLSDLDEFDIKLK